MTTKRRVRAAAAVAVKEKIKTAVQETVTTASEININLI